MAAVLFFIAFCAWLLLMVQPFRAWLRSRRFQVERVFRYRKFLPPEQYERRRKMLDQHVHEFVAKLSDIGVAVPKGSLLPGRYHVVDYIEPSQRWIGAAGVGQEVFTRVQIRAQMVFTATQEFRMSNVHRMALDIGVQADWDWLDRGLVLRLDAEALMVDEESETELAMLCRVVDKVMDWRMCEFVRLMQGERALGAGKDGG